MTKFIVTGIIIASLVFCFFWRRSKYFLVKIQVTSPILRPAILAGTVVSRSGSAGGVRINLIPQPYNKYDLPVVRTSSDANGDFSFPKVFPASYRLVATAQTDSGATKSAEMNITLAEGEQKKVNLSLDAASNSP